jgi:DNA mismatch repair protein MutS
VTADLYTLAETPDDRPPTTRDYYAAAKERHPGMLLMFRDGDRYMMFDDDAADAARLLKLTAATTPEGQTADFPHTDLETHLHALLRAGRRVAICDPVE